MIMKPYKALPPYKTINNIRSILESLDIFTTEYHIGLNNFYQSCRVLINNGELGQLNIGTNGKGLRTDYALASAYGELMERIQNRMIFKEMFYATSSSINKLKKNYPVFCQTLRDNGWELKFRYYPDETEYHLHTWSEFEEQIKAYLPQVYNDATKEEIEITKSMEFNHTLLQAPFYNINRQHVVNLPFQLIRLSSGSTGLCAGNTPEEAILQGINEIFERYVLQQIYIKQITPPTIPNSYFPNNEIIQRLDNLKKSQGITYKIKDCSLGKGFPVIGLLLIDTRNNRYSFRLGADANPEIALLRCYTEAFQGVNKDKHIFNPINFDDENVDYKREYNQNVINGSGRYPECIFLSIPTYPFQGLVRRNKDTDKEELKDIIKFIQSMDYTIYVRDSSFLNFPAYHIYIPGLSDVSSQLYSLTQIVSRLNDHDFTYAIPPEYHIKSIHSEEKRTLYSRISKRNENNIALFPYYISPNNTINKNLLLTLVSYQLSNLKEAFKHMSFFLEENEQKQIKIERYYYALRDFFYWKMKCNGDATLLLDILKNIYGEQLANEIIADTNDKDAIFQNFQMPNCFHCEECDGRTKCMYFSLLKLDVNIQNMYLQNTPQQDKLKETFI